MLNQLTVQHFAIVQFLELEFSHGMTTITGETGAGKSIAIDALGLCLGSRADANMVRVGTDKAEISARFTLTDTPHAKQWLVNNDLESDDDINDCLLRRTVNKEGRSRAYINGTPVPVSQLKSLGQLLVNIHGQHAHQSLLKSEIQLSIIDEYAAHHQLLQKVKDTYQGWHFLNKQLKQQQLNQQEKQARKQLLEYQIQELDEFTLAEEEFEQIEVEHKRLANGGALLESCQLTLNHLSEGEQTDALTLLRSSISALEAQVENDKNLENIIATLQESLIQIEDASYELRNFSENLELDPEKFQQLESRMSDALSLARKHQVQPEFLYSHHQKLSKEFKQLNSGELQIEQLSADLEVAENSYYQHAKKLSHSRNRYAKELSKKITSSIQKLNMQDGIFHIQLVENSHHALSPLGLDNIEFQVKTNAGQTLQSLAKVASGGELSRIGLAMQVIISQRVATPTLIFDEVDVGISGATAAVVGKLLRSLGEQTQIFCVTHLPQVAGNGHQQMFVAKQSNGKNTNTTMVKLSEKDRLNELARLVGGDNITAHTLANAKELLVNTVS
ncbi:DNA repair protein RecN [Psychromonas sp. Urea-02u-13]|uniref:DNA repair protein RecN n=1 Tax=Psychromonas sp. Urea-02u-13 TaxID=2058326 RepID=UPI000C31BF16|nr:DNA repair protein RecN [Psychromonas sp. Urea-02u-13]PKG38391.1 DNA repair protein RecN [Psychromonas sp. Urea-02u-13]